MYFCKNCVKCKEHNGITCWDLDGLLRAIERHANGSVSVDIKIDGFEAECYKSNSGYFDLLNLIDKGKSCIVKGVHSVEVGAWYTTKRKELKGAVIFRYAVSESCFIREGGWRCVTYFGNKPGSSDKCDHANCPKIAVFKHLKIQD